MKIDRAIVLIEGEILRHTVQAMCAKEPAIQVSHLEVAEALELAAKALERSNHICSSETDSSLPPRPLHSKRAEHFQGASPSPDR